MCFFCYFTTPSSSFLIFFFLSISGRQVLTTVVRTKKLEAREAAKKPGGRTITFYAGYSSHCSRKNQPHNFSWKKVLSLEETLNIESFSSVGIYVRFLKWKAVLVCYNRICSEKTNTQKPRRDCFYFILCFLALLKVEPRTVCKLGRCSTSAVLPAFSLCLYSWGLLQKPSQFLLLLS